MTIKTNIHDLTIEIKAKGLYNKNRYNKGDTYAFLNTISIFAAEAAKKYYAEGSDSLGEEAEEFADQLYNLLKDAGQYDN